MAYVESEHARTLVIQWLKDKHGILPEVGAKLVKSVLYDRPGARVLAQLELDGHDVRIEWGATEGEQHEPRDLLALATLH